MISHNIISRKTGCLLMPVFFILRFAQTIIFVREKKFTHKTTNPQE